MAGVYDNYVTFASQNGNKVIIHPVHSKWQRGNVLDGIQGYYGTALISVTLSSPLYQKFSEMCFRDYF